MASADPRHCDQLDLLTGSVDVVGGRIVFVHPRDPVALLDEEDGVGVVRRHGA